MTFIERKIAMQASLDWMDEVVEAHDHVREAEHSDRYEAFGTRMAKREVQLTYEGVIHLAHDTGLTIVFNPNWSEHHTDTGEAYIMYKNYRFFGLWDKKGA